jgi:uncharacterized delta-60 repeat protein
MLRRCGFACICALFAFAIPAHAASLDPNFGDGGRVLVNFGGMGGATAGDVAVQPDGRIVAIGVVSGSFALVRLLPNGRLDASFGRGGVVLSGFGSSDGNHPPRLALQPDGKLVVAGTGYNAPGSAVAVMRLNPDGSFDASFADGGKRVFTVGPLGDIGQDVALQPDGKIVVAGYTQRDMGNSDFAAIRLTPSGDLDPSFGSGGVAVVPMIPDSGLDVASSVAIAPDGGVLMAGVTARSDTGIDFALVRLTPSGIPDAAFGNDGRAELAIGSGAWQEIVRSMLVLPDGRFYVGGAALQPGFGPSQVALARFMPSGAADSAFGSGGQLLRALGTIEDTSSGIVGDESGVFMAVDSKVTSSQRRVGVLPVDAAGTPGQPLLFDFTPGGDQRAAGLALRQDGALVELATVYGFQNGGSAFGLAVVLPRSSSAGGPPPAVTPPRVQPVGPVSAITWPRRGSKLRRAKSLRGTSRGVLRVDRVEIALVRRAGRRCDYLTSRRPTFQPRGLQRTGSNCTQLIWKRASGTTAWSYKLRRPLPRGAYVLYSRARSGALIEAPPRRIAFTVR